MHVQVLDVVLVWLPIVLGTEPGETLVGKVCLHWVDSPYDHIEPAVELLLVQD